MANIALLSNEFKINITKTIQPSLGEKQVISNEFIIDVLDDPNITNVRPSISNIKVFNANVNGEYSLQFTIDDKNFDLLDVFIKMDDEDFRQIGENIPPGNITYKGTGLSPGIHTCSIKVSDKIEEYTSYKFEIKIPKLLGYDVFEDIKLLTKPEIQANQYTRVAIKLKSIKSIDEMTINPVIFADNIKIRNVQWEKGSIMTDYRPSINEISENTKEVKEEFDIVKDSVTKIENDYVTSEDVNELDNSIRTEIKKGYQEGIVNISKNGIETNSSITNSKTIQDESSFRVEDKNGGTVAEFSSNSTIPNLNSSVINSNEIYANNVINTQTSIDLYVDMTSGSDSNSGTSTSKLRTIQCALDGLGKFLDNAAKVNIYISGVGSQGVEIKGFGGSGTLSLYFYNSSRLHTDIFDIEECSCRIRVVGVNDLSTLSPQIIQSDSSSNIYIQTSSYVEVNNLCLVGNGSGNGVMALSSNVFVNNCEIDKFKNAIKTTHLSKINVINCIGSNNGYVIAGDMAGEVTFTGTNPSWVNTEYSDTSGVYTVNGEIKTKTDGIIYPGESSIPSSPTTSTSNTRVWNFNKIWSDETLKGWSNRNELIQGYNSAYNTGRWTGYLQMTDNFTGIKDTLVGATNLTGRIFVQRTDSSGNSTNSKLCMYASDGTVITTTTSINRGQGVWVALNSSVCQKIQSGVIKYFYLKADTSNAATYFKLLSNAKIEITYNK